MSNIPETKFNVAVMENFLKLQNDFGISEQVKAGKISLGLQGERLVIRQNCDSFMTKISNFFRGIKLIDTNLIKDNVNAIQNFENRFKDISGSIGIKKGEICLGLKGGRLVTVENAHKTSTKIYNFFCGISTNRDKIQKVYEDTVSFENLKEIAKAQPSLKKTVDAQIAQKIKADKKAAEDFEANKSYFQKTKDLVAYMFSGPKVDAIPNEYGVSNEE